MGERKPKISGFEVQTVTAWWVVCSLCEDAELVYGEGKPKAVREWAAEHAKDCSERPHA